MTNNQGGILILNKPEGMTSHDAVSRIRRLFFTKQVGHTGTLDPMATGVLCVLVGRAVKASEFAVEHDKSYTAGIKLGVTTDTGDITGKIMSQTGFLPGIAEVADAVSSFQGEILQVPPMYSAIKINGNKLCDLARKGITVDRPSRPVSIYSIRCRSHGSNRGGEYLIDVSCSKGTYIRTLCEDIGKKLGCGATMSSLVRTRSGSFSIAESVTFEELESMTEEQRWNLLVETEKLFEVYPIVKLSDFFAKLALSGNQIYLKKIGADFNVGQKVRLYDNEFFSLGEVLRFPEGMAIKPVKKFRME